MAMGIEESHTVRPTIASRPLNRFARHLLGARQGSIGEPTGSDHLLRIIQNAGWLLGERGVIMLTGMLVGVWLARYLGPTDFGIYSYALSLVALFGFLPVFGLQGIVTRELVTAPEDREEILGTVFVLRLVGAALGVVAITTFVLLYPGDLTTRLMIAIIAFGLPFDAFSIVDLWFQSRNENKYSVLVRSAALLLAMSIKIALILMSAPLVAFALAEVVQHVLRASGFILAYRWTGHYVRRWRQNWTLAARLLRQSWPIVLSSAGALLYLKIDQVMIGEMVGAREVGIYAVAARLSEVWYVIPMAVGTAIFPAIVRSSRLQDPLYHDRLQRAYVTMAWLAFAIALTVTLVSDQVIQLMFGSEYAGASRILAVHIWTCPAVFMGAVFTRWLIAEDLLIFALTRHGLGAIVNITLNLFLIPAYGGLGAAIATLVSYSAAHYLACYTDARTRIAGQMMTRALLSPVRLSVALVRKATTL